MQTLEIWGGIMEEISLTTALEKITSFNSKFNIFKNTHPQNKNVNLVTC